MPMSCITRCALLLHVAPTSWLLFGRLQCHKLALTTDNAERAGPDRAWQRRHEGWWLTVSSWESSCQRMISAAQTTLLVLHAASIRFRMATHSRRCTSRNSGHQIMSWVVVKPEQPRATCVGVEVVVTSKPISAMT